MPKFVNSPDEGLSLSGLYVSNLEGGSSLRELGLAPGDLVKLMTNGQVKSWGVRFIRGITQP